MICSTYDFGPGAEDVELLRNFAAVGAIAHVPFLGNANPGMFGRLQLPVGEREVVRIPASAVARTGQLETVLVQSDGGWQRRLVTTGAKLPDGEVEILSGLAGGETVGTAAP